MIVDPALQAKLATAGRTIELCDNSGRILGHFIPFGGLEPKVSEEELDRRQQQGGGRSLKSILLDLEKRA